MNENVFTLCGTPEYMAPEKLLGNGDSTVTDYWSLGCLIYEMLLGEPPFYAEVPQLIYKKVISEEVKIPYGLSSEAKDLLIRLLAKNRCNRLGFNGTEEIMKHPFFYGVDWNRVKDSDYKSPFQVEINQFESLQSEDFEREKLPTKTSSSYRRIFRIRKDE
ncbi:unnamed protein product [Medioppia subpectinata]|uniref:Uncharacterized protein n=1 Tax=Medioppia subpectinata TaxID=1979941 RepID=A0A7R9LPH3_9ACAR|nr:unnamed protein product [Medioppia subpectinata]CAG2120049.1 unnamed protein product [Medioppia subpectinata]